MPVTRELIDCAQEEEVMYFNDRKHGLDVLLSEVGKVTGGSKVEIGYANDLKFGPVVVIAINGEMLGYSTRDARAMADAVMRAWERSVKEFPGEKWLDDLHIEAMVMVAQEMLEAAHKAEQSSPEIPARRKH